MSKILEMAKNKSKTLGKFVVELRKSRDISQRELAAVINTSGPYVAQIEMDRYRLPLDFVKSLKLILNKQEKTELLEILVRYMKEDCGL